MVTGGYKASDKERGDKEDVVAMWVMDVRVYYYKNKLATLSLFFSQEREDSEISKTSSIK